MPSREEFERIRRDKFLKDVSHIYNGIDSSDPRFETANIRELHIIKVAHLVYALLAPFDESLRNTVLDKIKELLDKE